MAFLADPLSITMCLFVTGVGALIHLYAVGYMHGDAKFSKFFLYMNLFAFAMLVLVLGENLLVTFLGWEGVGTCSYFLIAFWHPASRRRRLARRPSSPTASATSGSCWRCSSPSPPSARSPTSAINGAAEEGLLAVSTATAIGGLLFLGAVGKSPSCRCTSGCPTRWKARHPCRH